MKNTTRLLLSLFLIITITFGAAGETLSKQLQAYSAEIATKGEIGSDFNLWKSLYNEAVEMGNRGLYGTKTFQAVLEMTIGVKGNYEKSFQKMKDNKFLQSLAKGDYLDYGLSGVRYLAKAYAKSNGQVKVAESSVIAEFHDNSEETSWHIKNAPLLAKELGVTQELMNSWIDALDAYVARKTYSYTPQITPKPTNQSSSSSTSTQKPTQKPSLSALSKALSAQEHESLKEAGKQIQPSCTNLLEQIAAIEITNVRVTYLQNKATIACYIHIPYSSAEYKQQLSTNSDLQKRTQSMMEKVFETICTEIDKITSNQVFISVNVIDPRNTVICKYEDVN